MALILSLDTSTKVCSVALHQDGILLAVSEVLVEKSHSKIITVMVEDILRNSGRSYNELDAIAVSKGPGSYTGLRIGVSTAKGLCFALNKPLIGINTLQAMAAEVNRHNAGSAILCPMIDARRMEVYTALFDTDLNFIDPTTAKILDENSFHSILASSKMLFFGDGSSKAIPLLKSSVNAVFIEGIYPSAKGVGFLAQKNFNDNNFENTAYFEPFYLKDFVSQTK